MTYRARCQAKKERILGRVEIEPRRNYFGDLPISRKSFVAQMDKDPTRFHYRLRRKKKTHEPCTPSEWVIWSRSGDNRIALTIVGGFKVSTVFLGLDHNFSMIGPPRLYETMVFQLKDDGSMTSAEEKGFNRYCTWAEAELGHEEIVQELKRGLN